MLGKGSPEGGGHGTAAVVQEASEQHCQTYGLISGYLCEARSWSW